MLEFRTDSEKIIGQLRKGERMVLTYRGKPVGRLEPIVDQAVPEDDPFYRLDQLADEQCDSLTNADMDEIVYEV